MALDTIRLRSIPLSLDIAKRIEQESIRRQGLDLSTGEVLYQITTGELEGTYDSRISLQIKDVEWIRATDGKTRLSDCEPYLIIECSVHKLLAGHNCWGGPTEFQLCCFYIVNFVEKALDITLPDFDTFKVERIDFARTFLLPSSKAVEEFFRGLQVAEFSRRTVNRYGFHGLHIGGSTTTLKFYHKGIEFKKHDRSKLVKYGVDSSTLFQIQEKANRILRVELGIKDRKLRYDFKGKGGSRGVYVSMVNDDYIKKIWNREVDRFLKENITELELVRDADKVKKRIDSSSYKKPTQRSLFGTWLQLKTLGESKTKEVISLRTFYRHRKMLKDLGISWNGSEEIGDFGELPEGFSPQESDKHHLIVEHIDVWKKMKWYRENINLEEESSLEKWNKKKKATHESMA